MSKSSKPVSHKANEIKDLLLDVIQQEDSSMSESEIYRLSQPYKKADGPPAPTPQIEKEPDLELNFAEDNPELPSAVLSPDDAGFSDEESMLKLDFDLNAGDAEAQPELQRFEKTPTPASSSKDLNEAPKPYQPDKTVKLSSVSPQSRAPIEFKMSEEKSAAPKPVPVAAPVNSNESTVKLTPKLKTKTSEVESRVASGSSATDSGVRYKPEVQIGVSSPTEAVLKQAENLRIAQIRITSLEDELEKVRQQNSQLSSAGDILRRRADELLSQSENFQNKIQESAVIFEEEKKVLKAQIQSKDRELELRRQKVEQLEQRLTSQFDSIRRRERELEHRLEILKVENQDILNGKDKMILDLKRQVDLLNTEVNFSKERTQELYGQHKDKQETIRRVVKALRMALTILEGDEETKTPLKKVD